MQNPAILYLSFSRPWEESICNPPLSGKDVSTDRLSVSIPPPIVDTPFPNHIVLLSHRAVYLFICSRLYTVSLAQSFSLHFYLSLCSFFWFCYQSRLLKGQQGKDGTKDEMKFRSLNGPFHLNRTADSISTSTYRVDRCCVASESTISFIECCCLTWWWCREGRRRYKGFICRCRIWERARSPGKLM